MLASLSHAAERARVSSATQIEAWGLDRQESAVRKWAKANGHRITEWRRDEGRSGTIEAVERGDQRKRAIEGM